jgi:transposase
MRTIGIDLAVKASHKATVMNAEGEFVTPVLSFHARWDEIKQVVARAREGVEPDHPLQAVMEPTGMAWLTVAVPLSRMGVSPIYLVNGRKVHDLRRFYKRHSSSDRISARVLARMPVVDPESLYPLEIPTAVQFACQRGCKELDRLEERTTAIKNRLRDTDRFAWPGLESVFKDIFSPAARLFRETWYDPVAVLAAGIAQVRQSFLAVAGQEDDLAWVEDLVQLAIEVLVLYGPDALDYPLLQQQVCRDQRWLTVLEAEADAVWQETVRPLYHQLHPSRDLETLYGVGEKGAAVYASFIGRAARFPSNRKFRGWHGLIPDSRQSGEAESKGLHVSQAGPDPIKKFGYLGGDVARRYDPQIAVIYHDQMMNKGTHHNQAVCACATHLLDRVRIVLLEDRPYELRDVDGTPVTPEQARAIIAERYTVPNEVRQRNNRRARKKRAEQRAEREWQRRQRRRKGSRPRL